MPNLETIASLGRLFQYVPGTYFWAKDRESRFVAANPAFYGNYGLNSFGEMEGKTDLDFSPRPLALEYMNDDRQVMLTRKPLVNKFELVYGRDGDLKWFSTTKVPLLASDAQGKEVAIGTAGFTRPVEPFRESRGAQDDFARIVETIQKRYSEELNIKDLAKMAGFSVVQFERNFRKLMNETPVKYIQRVRMQVACQLLVRSDLPIARIAEKAGFADESYFARRFRLHFRIAPGEYRRKYRMPYPPDAKR